MPSDYSNTSSAKSVRKSEPLSLFRTIDFAGAKSNEASHDRDNYVSKLMVLTDRSLNILSVNVCVIEH